MSASIYVLQDGFGRVKLGISANPKRRSTQYGPTVMLAHSRVMDQARKIEKLAHRVLALHGKHVRGEWFEASVSDAIEAIDIAVRQAENGELPLGGKLNGGTSDVRAELRERVERDRAEAMVLVRFHAPEDGEITDCLAAIKRDADWFDEMAPNAGVVLLRLLKQRPELVQLLQPEKRK